MLKHIKTILSVAIAISSLGVQAAETVDFANYYDVKEAAPAQTSSPTATPAPTTTPTGEEKLQELDYNQVKATEGAEMQKGLEFAVSKELANTNNANEISIKNEYPESLKIVFEAIGESIEIYLNAYELLDKVALNKNSEYKIRVYNIYNDYLGYIRSPSALTGQLQISPFLLVRDSIIEAPTVKFVKKENLTDNKPETPTPIVADVLESVELKDEFAAEKKSLIPVSKRYLRIANISKAQVHIDIVEPGNQTLGDGWTITNDIYEPQFLNLQSKPIQISDEADLLVTQAISNTTVKKKAKELNIDERGNFVWLIDNLALSSPQ